MALIHVEFHVLLLSYLINVFHWFSTCGELRSSVLFAISEPRSGLTTTVVSSVTTSRSNETKCTNARNAARLLNGHARRDRLHTT